MKDLRLLTLIALTTCIILIGGCSSSETPPKTQAEIDHDAERDMANAIYAGNVGAVQSLLEEHSDLFCQDTCSKEINYGITVATSYDRGAQNPIGFRTDYVLAVLPTFLDKNPRIKEARKNDYSEDTAIPFEYALQMHNIPIAIALLNHAEFTKPLNWKWIANHVVAQNWSSDQSISLIEALRKKGLDMQELNQQIAYAVLMDRGELAKYLMRSGVQLPEDDRDVVHQYATADLEDPELLKMLIKDGADIYAKDGDGLNALEARMTLTPPPSRTLIKDLEAVGLTFNAVKVKKRLEAYGKSKEDYCNDLNTRWFQGVSKALRGENLSSAEDVSVPQWCLPYLK